MYQTRGLVTDIIRIKYKHSDLLFEPDSMDFEKTKEPLSQWLLKN
jgi:hypothetical protein